MSSRSVEYVPRSDSQAGVFRLCLDLNVWCAWVLSGLKRRRGTAAHVLVQAVRDGRCSLGATQLVISWSMLTRLRSVLVDHLRLGIRTTEALLADIISFAQFGPSEDAPFVLLGGTGIVPLSDPEDLHVLEVAIAGRADLLATFDFSDFVNYRTEVLKPGRIARYRTADHELLIAHPAEVAAWIRTGEIVLA